MKNQFDHYKLIKTIFSSKDISFFISSDVNTGEKFFLRLFHNPKMDRGAQNNWFTFYDFYQLNIMNYKYLPRISTISKASNEQVYTVIPYTPGKSFLTSEKLNSSQLEQIIEGIQHLHQKDFVHGNVVPENIWITDDERVILFGAGEWKVTNEVASKKTDIQQVIKIANEISDVYLETNSKINKITDLLSTIKGPQFIKPGLIEKELPQKEIIISAPELVENKNFKKKKSFWFGIVSIITLIIIAFTVFHFTVKRPSASKDMNLKTYFEKKKVSSKEGKFDNLKSEEQAKKITSRVTKNTEILEKLYQIHRRNHKLDAETEMNKIQLENVLNTLQDDLNNLKMLYDGDPFNHIMTMIESMPLMIQSVDNKDLLLFEQGYSYYTNGYLNFIDSAPKTIKEAKKTFPTETKELEVQKYGEITYDDGSIYKGELVNGLSEGKGTYTEPDGTKYVGNFVNDEKNGHGVTTRPDGQRHEGNYKNGQYQGKGTYTWPDGTKYEGNFVNGLFQGNGTYIGPDGTKYVGNFVNDEKNGHGVTTRPDGQRHEGNYKNGQYQGNGVYTWPDGTKYMGNFVNGLFQGNGTYTWPDGTKYVGNFVNDEKNGHGVTTWPDGSRHEGNYKNDKAKGKGVKTWPDGTKFVGEFDNDDYTDNGTWTYP